MNQDEIQNIINYAYPKIQKYFGKGKKDYPNIELHKDIYARLSGDEEAEGEHSSTSIAEYDIDANTIYIYYPNIKNEEDIIRSLIHEYIHYTQDSKLLKQYRALYSYNEDPFELEATKSEDKWLIFSQK